MSQGTVGRGMLYAALVFAFFSTADAIVKWLTAGYSVFQITFVTSIFALGPVFWLAWRTGGARSLIPRHPGWVFLRAAMLVCESLLCYYAFSKLPLAEVYPLIFATPILVTVLAVPLLGEVVGWRRMAAVAVGFIGVLIVIRPGFRELDSGHIAALCSTLMFSLGMIILRHLGDENFGALLLSLIGGRIVVAGILMIPFGGFVPLEWTNLGLMAVIGVLAGAAQCFLVLAIRYAPASVVSPFQYSQLLWGIFYGFVIFGTGIDGMTLLGAAVIVGAGLFILKREREAKAEAATGDGSGGAG